MGRDLTVTLIVLASVVGVVLILFLLFYRWRICCDIGKNERQHQILLRYRSRTISSRISVDEEASGAYPTTTRTNQVPPGAAMPVDPPPYELECSCATPPAYDSLF